MFLTMISQCIVIFYWLMPSHRIKDVPRGMVLDPKTTPIITNDLLHFCHALAKDSTELGSKPLQWFQGPSYSALKQIGRLARSLANAT